MKFAAEEQELFAAPVLAHPSNAEDLLPLSMGDDAVSSLYGEDDEYEELLDRHWVRERRSHHERRAKRAGRSLYRE